MKKEIINLKIGELGSIDINIPTIKVGSGKPKVLFICGMHGTEITGLFVIQKLLESLDLERGELNIITGANPFAQGLKIKQNPTDSFNLNRAFPGDMKKELSDRLAAVIFQEAIKCDLVIDFHSFEDQSPIIAIFVNHGKEKIKERARRFIKLFSPDLVWQLDINDSKEKSLNGCLCPFLAEKGVTSFALELPNEFQITSEEITKVVAGLKNILADLQMLEAKVKSPKNKITIVERNQLRSDISGLFIPKKKLMGAIQKDDEIGEIISLKNFEKKSIKSPWKGPLIVLKDRALVRTGDALFTVGKKIGEI